MIIVKYILKIFLPIIVIAGGLYYAQVMINNRPKPPTEEIKPLTMPVEIITTVRSDQQIVINGFGTVKPSKQINLQPQVSGLVIEQSDELLPGGRFKQGDMIAKIDSQDYQYVVEQRKERLEFAEFNLKQEQSQQIVAESEWKLLGNDVKTTDAGRELALRKPHLKYAQAAKKAAKSSLDDALLDVKRTTIRAPFNCLVIEEFVDLGQLVSPQNRLTTLVGTDTYWIEGLIKVTELPWINLPDTDNLVGSEVSIIHDTGEHFYLEKRGKIIRLIGDLNQSHMLRVLIEVEDPLGIHATEETHPLILNAFVRLTIEGKTAHDVIVIPEGALREGNQVWVMNQQNQLEIRTVTILFKQNDDVLIDQGLEEGERIVTSIISAPIPGIPLEIIDKGLEQGSSTASPITNSPDDKNGKRDQS